MKKLISICLVLVMVLCSCGKKESESESSSGGMKESSVKESSSIESSAKESSSTESSSAESSSSESSSSESSVKESSSAESSAVESSAEPTKEPTKEPDKNAAVYKAYADFLEENKARIDAYSWDAQSYHEDINVADFGTVCFDDVTNDDIPELIYIITKEAENNMLLAELHIATYENGAVKDIYSFDNWNMSEMAQTEFQNLLFKLEDDNRLYLFDTFGEGTSFNVVIRALEYMDGKLVDGVEVLNGYMSDIDPEDMNFAIKGEQTDIESFVKDSIEGLGHIGKLYMKNMTGMYYFTEEVDIKAEPLAKSCDEAIKELRELAK
ncbi:MAG: hypothetical protein J6M24_00360 [Lachnospiraceae bacterium]|nr:hypothetical protein [Lachnospiraceae bacterium]